MEIDDMSTETIEKYLGTRKEEDTAKKMPIKEEMEKHPNRFEEFIVDNNCWRGLIIGGLNWKVLSDKTNRISQDGKYFVLQIGHLTGEDYFVYVRRKLE